MSAPAARFADAAVRLCGQCALMVGWRPDEFWLATPAEVAAIFSATHEPQSNDSVTRDDIQRMMEQDHG